MSATIDERVVSMSFENAKFEAGVAKTMATLTKLNITLSKVGSDSNLSNIEKDASKVTLQGPMSALDKLKQKLGMAGNTKGFADIESASSKVTLEGPVSALDKVKQKLGLIGDTRGFAEIEGASSKVTLAGLTGAIDHVKVRLGAMQTAAIAAFGTIASRATLATGALVKDISLGPITQGLQEYSTNLNSIQTILANTQASGATLQDVNKALQQLNHYSDQTIYNFSQMADSIGLFTAAGVNLKTSVSSIKGLANLAALSGSGNEKATHAMQQLSQAIAAGKVTMQDWISVRNAGMGGTVFQRALAQTASAMGTIKKGALELEGPMKNVKINGESFAESIRAKPGEESWLTSKVLTSTLEQFTGDMTDAELAAQGFTQAQIEAIQKQAATAKKAATEVKTMKQVWDVAKESIGSGWSATFQTIFGNFTEAKSTFTDLSDAITGLVGKNADARNKILKDWKALGGRTVAIEGIKNLFHALGQILGTVKEAFRDIFPAKTGKDLFALTQAFRDFAKHLQSSPETLENLRRTFRGFFSVLSIGWYIVKKVIGVIFDLLGLAKDGSGGFLAFTAGIGDFLTALHKAVVEGDALGGVFKGIAAVLRIPLEILKALAQAFFGLFDGMDSKKADAAGKSIDGVSDSLRPMENALNGVVDAWHKFIKFLEQLKDKIAPALHTAFEPFRHIGDLLKEAFSGDNADAAFDILKSTLLGGILLSVKKLLHGVDINVGGDTLGNVNNVLKGLTGNLTALQKNIQAKTLFAIAAAIVTLAGGVYLLSTIDPKKLTVAMTAVAVGLGQLVAALAILSKVTSGASFVTMPLIAASLIELAGAVVILAGAVKIFSTMSWEDLVKGLFGVGGALAAVGAGMKFIGPSLTLSAPGIVAVALAMNVLAVAMKIFGSFSWDEIIKGLIGVGGSLLALGLGAQAFGPSILLIGPGLIAAAAGLTLLSGAVASFGGMDLGDLVKGIAGMGAALLVLGAAISAIPPTVALQAAGLIVLSVALTGIAGAIKLMGSMDIPTLAKGITGLALALVVLATGLEAMVGTLPGSAALLAAAAALTLLAPTLGFLGTLEWGTIFKGLAAIALTLATLSIVGEVAAGGLIALGIALGIVSVAVIGIGAGLYLMAKAFETLGNAGTKSVAVMIAALTAFVAILPKIIINFIKGLAEIAIEVAKLLPTIVVAIGTIVKSILDVIIKATPKIGEAISGLIQMFLKVIDENAGPIIASGLKLLQNFLSGIANNIGSVTTKVALIITRFLEALANKLPEIIAGGAHLLISFLSGITQHLPAVIASAARLIVTFLNALASHTREITTAAINVVIKFAVALLNGAWRLVNAGVTFVLKVLKGIADRLPDVRKAATHLIRVLMTQLVKALIDLAHIAFDGLIGFLNGFAGVIHDKAPMLRRAMRHLAFEMADAFTFGLLGKVQGAANDFAAAVLDNEVPESQVRAEQEQGRRAAAGAEQAYRDAHGGRSRYPRRPKAAVMPKGAVAGVKKLQEAADQLQDIQPVIAPVLDLSEVEKGAKKIADVTARKPILADISFKQAEAISSEKSAADAARAEQDVVMVPKEIKFEQHNTSPESLSDAEIYRKTSNLLSQAKKELQTF